MKKINLYIEIPSEVGEKTDFVYKNTDETVCIGDLVSFMKIESNIDEEKFYTLSNVKLNYIDYKSGQVCFEITFTNYVNNSKYTRQHTAKKSLTNNNVCDDSENQTQKRGRKPSKNSKSKNQIDAYKVDTQIMLSLYNDKKNKLENELDKLKKFLVNTTSQVTSTESNENEEKKND